MIECFPETRGTTESEFFTDISNEEMSRPIHFDEQEDEIILFNSQASEQPPPLPAHNLPNEFLDKQRVSYNRAADMDFDFLKVSQ